MDDQINELQDDKISFIEAFRQLVQFAQIDESRKQYFLSLLTESRYNSMTADDSAELIQIAETAQDQLEQKIIDSSDPEMIDALTDLKEFTYSLLNEAEEKGYRLVLGDQVVGVSNAAKEQSAKWLLDKFAGLTEEVKQDQSE